MEIPDVFKDVKIGDALDFLFNARTPGPATPEPSVDWPTSDLPRRFVMNRRKDHSGVSGTGIVASGVEFHDGTVAVRWKGKDPSTSVWKNVAALEAVHGHEGSTQIEWID